jgi:hypothetical protein
VQQLCFRAPIKPPRPEDNVRAPSVEEEAEIGLAESTGLEPATSAVTGQRSNQLSYDSNLRKAKLEPIAFTFNRNFAGTRHLALHQDFNRFFELRILAFSCALGVVSHFDIGLHLGLFHKLPLFIPKTNFWNAEN